MPDCAFWYIDDNHHVRWAVCVTGGAERRIVFTSRDQQIATGFDLDSDESALSRYEILELLSLAKQEAICAHASV